jgi:hypothetical protein
MTEFVTVVADDLARAWLDTILDVAAQPDQKAFHVVTRIRNSGDDGEQRIHHAASDLLVRLDRQPVDTVANTIFPAAMARQTPDVDALAARYENLYPQLRRLDSQNRYGTYFHRLVAYPGPNGPVNQLAKVIGNLTSELANRSPKRARYEVSLETPGEAGDGTDETLAPDHEPVGSEAVATAATPILTPGKDNRMAGFPCLSFLSYQHDGTNLHAVAHYRSQFLLARGLGNYLGIARLQRYVAERVGLEPGTLTVVVGHAYADQLKKPTLAQLQAFRDSLDAAAATSAATAQSVAAQ